MEHVLHVAVCANVSYAITGLGMYILIVWGTMYIDIYLVLPAECAERIKLKQSNKSNKQEQ